MSADAKTQSWARTQLAKNCPWLRPWVGSKWFAGQCSKYPSWLESIVAEHQSLCTTSRYHKRWRVHLGRMGLNKIDDEAQLMHATRLFRHYEIARIIYKDFNRVATTQAVCSEISALAECLIQVTLDWHYRKLSAEFGTPIDQQGKQQRLGVIGMGKIGGAELNLSSDIDLIFVFPEAGEVRPHKSRVQLPMDNQQFFEKHAQAIINTMSAQTADGSVWKIDTRLRPYGEDGLLVHNHRSMELYYETQGREWERFAMCRARAVAGDKQGTQSLIARLRPFVFRRYLDFNALRSLTELRQNINAQMQPEEAKTNIKLGSGGIREAEFCIQLFQLVYGGKQISLRNPSIFKTLKQLVIHKHLRPQQQDVLEQAYCFLRNTEHALQAYDNRQTHTLPSTPQERGALTVAMHCSSWLEFKRKLRHHRQIVQALFEELTLPAHSTDHAQDRRWQQLWQHPQSAATHAYFSEHNAETTQALIAQLVSFRNQRALSRLDASEQMRLDRFMPRLLEQLLNSNAVESTIDHCFNLVYTILKRSNYLVLLEQNPRVLARVVDLCARSPWLSRHLIEQPMLLDQLLDTRTLYQVPSADTMRTQLQDHISTLSAEHGADRSDTLMTALKQFHKSQLLRISIQDLDHLLSLNELSEQLSAVAETTLDSILKLSIEEMIHRFGVPESGTGERGSDAQDCCFCIIAYGKLGGAQMSYSSDLDLVFLYDAPAQGLTRGKSPVENVVFYTRLSQRILSYLNNSGIYKTDIRLRPSGYAGVLVSTYDAFWQYQQQQAWTWEHQALISARATSGHPQLRQKFEELRRLILSMQRTTEEVRDKILAMRHKMDTEMVKRNADFRHLIKHAPGGMIDIEFITQYLVLSHAHRYPELLVARSTDSLLERIAKCGLLSGTHSASLQRVYSAFTATVNHHALCGNSALSADQIAHYQTKVRTIWKAVLGVHRTPEAGAV